MPKRPPTLCNHMGCPELTHSGYCEQHKTARHSDYKVNRTDKKEQAFYNSPAWKKTRDYKKATSPLCEHCLLNDRYIPMNDVDHITPIKVDWTARLSLANLQSLCRACHNLKTQEDKLTYNGQV